MRLILPTAVILQVIQWNPSNTDTIGPEESVLGGMVRLVLPTTVILQVIAEFNHKLRICKLPTALTGSGACRYVENRFDEANLLKAGHYADLMQQVTISNYSGTLLTLEVGS